MPCPACGTALVDDECPNPDCPMKQEVAEDWAHTTPEEMKTLGEWMLEFDIDDVPEDQFEMDNPDRKYTKSDFLRRSGLSEV